MGKLQQQPHCQDLWKVAAIASSLGTDPAAVGTSRKKSAPNASLFGPSLVPHTDSPWDNPLSVPHITRLPAEFLHSIAID